MTSFDFLLAYLYYYDTVVNESYSDYKVVFRFLISYCSIKL